jgi:hypothetical protein
MKKILLLAAAGLVLFGCADKKAQEQSLRDSVIAIHEKVMGEDEKLENNKTALGAFLKANPAGPMADSTNFLANKLTLADSAMMIWMHDFNPDLTNKPHDENMAYLGKQKKLVMQIDSQMNAAIAASDKFIAKTKTK